MGAFSQDINIIQQVYALSLRQRQCMTLVAKGFTSKEIAKDLALSPSTVDNHIRAVVDRLGAANRIEAARLIQLVESGAYAAVNRPEISANSSAIETARDSSHQPSQSGILPPLGGQSNRLSAGARIFEVLKIALLGTMIFAAITATIAGIVSLFQR